MNLVIDQGNSTVTMALFDSDGTIRKEAVYRHGAQPDLAEWMQAGDVTHALFSTVRAEKQEAALYKQLCSRLPQALYFDASTRLPITLGYRTPQTLGRDRIAAVVGAVTEHPGKPCLIIDAGTAVTYDFVTAEGCFVGGNIAPGCKARFRSLHEYTGALPMVKGEGEWPFLGVDTPTAIRSGVLTGMLYEMERYIETLQVRYPDILIFLTGGDSKYFASKLKRGIFAETNLVLKGLNRILNDNTKIIKP